MANYTDYGFQDLTHVWSQRVTDVGAQVVNERVALVVQFYNQALTKALGLLSQPTETRTELVHLLVNGTLQPLSETGVPIPRKPSASYTVAYPIDGGGDAWGDNRVSRELMTVEEVARNLNQVLNADTTWMRTKMLAAIFDNTNRPFTDAQGAITVLPLANGDAQTYALRSGGMSTDNHYLAQANAIGNGADNPFPDIYTELAEHPSNNVSDQNPVVVYVASEQAALVASLANLNEYHSGLIIPGISNNRANPIVAQWIAMGDKVIGEVDGCVVVEWGALPTGYSIAVATGADRPLRQREYPAAGLKGLFQEFNTPDGNHQEYRFIRQTGFGVRDRAAVAVLYSGTSGTYAIPANYSTPTTP